MPKVKLICRDAAVRREHAALLEKAGFVVTADEPTPTGLTKSLRADPPDAVVIDLDRQPSFGREIAVMIRNNRYTRSIPLVFAGGIDDKVARIRAELPDATYCAWKTAPARARKAIRQPVKTPIKPPAHMERYAQTPLAAKLGIKAGMKVALQSAAPELTTGVEEHLREQVPEARLLQRLSGDIDLALFFVLSLAEVDMAFETARSRLGEGRSLWIVSPKQTGRLKAGFNQNDVRDVGLRSGWVDYKVCSVDADWSGLKFARQRPD
jgi:CheY-like chemotaxis protein